MKPGTVASKLSVLRRRLRLAQEWGYVVEAREVSPPPPRAKGA
jgi:hypothetical protein